MQDFGELMREIESADATSCDIYFRELTAETGGGNYDAVTDIVLFAKSKLEHANPGTVMERHILVLMVWSGGDITMNAFLNASFKSINIR